MPELGDTVIVDGEELRVEQVTPEGEMVARGLTGGVERIPEDELDNVEVL